MFWNQDKSTMVNAEEALPGNEQVMPVADKHVVLGHSLTAPFPDGYKSVLFGMGCFWGAERKFWQLPGVYTTAVGYGAGFTKNPTYEQVCSGKTGHNELVLVVYNPNEISIATLLKTFWQSHNPTQGMRQGNDRGTQYRSGIYYYDEEQRVAAEDAKSRFALAIKDKGLPSITTEILAADQFYYAENYHQQYLHKNPAGYCGLGGIGVELS